MMEPLEVLAHLASVGTPPDAETAFMLAVGLDGAIQRMADETLPFLRGGGCELQFVYGQYGRGKTHFLHTLGALARRQGFVTAYVDCRMGHSPFRSIRDTYAMIAASMQAPDLDDRPPIPRGLGGVIARAFDQKDERAAEQWLRDIREAPSLAPDYRNTVYAYARSLMLGQARGQPAESLAALLRADAGYRVTLGELHRAHPHLPRPIGKLGKRNAGLWLRSLLSLPWMLGYPGLVLLFDETERGHSFGRSQSPAQQTHLANLRNFVDHMALGAFRGVSIHYAVVEDFIELARERLAALSQRIERVRVAWPETADDRPIANPRAVWVSLDELTQPSPLESEFFERLGFGIVEVGLRAGLPDARAPMLRQMLSESSARYADSIFEGAVREFVKFAASMVAREVSQHVR